ncbi:hypothetical protein E1A91_D03G105200v1 [Gossypium mustelinum]|uniref:Uncharacterized protein n=1 Tax=Gossypium mustelinum TaxID=34275 RepID=A0A5D2VLY6_GOSMU|nr:hypothetical protein E1A91_D03G105200v1 [Gossypium mustelinum]
MAKSSKLASSDVELYNGSSSSKEERMNAQVNGEEDDEEEIEAVARSVDTFGEDDDIVPEEIVDDVDDDEYNGANPEISKREKERLKEMQKLKKQKIQEILDTQNAAIDADMVRILGKMELASKEKSKASAVAVNAEIRRTKARLLEEVPKLQRLAVKKVKGISTEEMAARNDQMSSSPSTSSTAIKFDSDERFDNKYFQEFEQSSQFRQDYEMRKMKQACQTCLGPILYEHFSLLEGILVDFYLYTPHFFSYDLPFIAFDIHARPGFGYDFRSFGYFKEHGS